MFRLLFAALSLPMLALLACKDDEPVGNHAPDTRLMADSIQLTGPDRLLTRVRLYWTGDDRDGFVQRFEFSFDNQTWNSTTQTDSLLELSIPVGQDTADIRFWVRAVDNEGLIDPTPAYLSIPIRNSAPVISFNPTILPRDTVFSILTFGFLATDPDGQENLSRVEVKLNDGPWTEVTLSADVITLRSLSPTATGPTEAEVFKGVTGTRIDGLQLSGYNLNGLNTVYIRCFDLAETQSNVDTLPDIYVRNKGSEILMLDLWPEQPKASTAFLPILESDSVFGNIDFIDIADTNNVPAQPVLTFGKLFELYDVIFLNVIGTNASYLARFEELEGVLQKHLASNGKLWLNMPVQKTLDTESSLFRYGIIERMVNLPLDTTVRLPNTLNGGQLTPVGAVGPVYPVIQNLSGSLISNFFPFKPANGAQALYTGNFVRSPSNPAPWGDPEATALMARRQTSGVTQLIYSGFPISRLVDGANQNSALGTYFVRVKQDFGL